ncbi:corticostatin-3-like [Saimiri boliviensis]|uniref:corticostatin-3-like n=1 Tax=Saimiri boliviensis TaxID=27679 RepID=UPI003D781E9D
MRTLATLAAILLVALQAQAQPTLERADKVAAQEPPASEGRDFAICLTRDASSDFRASETCWAISPASLPRDPLDVLLQNRTLSP